MSRGYFVRINRRTFKRNDEDAGPGHAYCGSTAELTIAFNGMARLNKRVMSLLEKSGARITSRSSDFDREKLTYILGNTKYAETLCQLLISYKYVDKGKTSMNIQNYYQTIHTLGPGPEFSFEFRNRRVKCLHCKSTFHHTHLREEGDEDYEGNYHGRSNICPVCNEEDCCTLTFERPRDVAKELGI